MTRRKFYCPHCSKQIKVVANQHTYNYLYCPDCNLKYVMNRNTGSYISEYAPRIKTIFKGVD